MKYYQASRSLYGELGSIRRNEVLQFNDPRLRGKERAVTDLLERKLLVAHRSGEETEHSKQRETKRSAHKKDPDNEAS